MTIPFIDIHSHKAADNGFSIYNLSLESIIKIENKQVSIGIHPWFINLNTIENDMLLLKQWAGNKNVVAIGECGIDKLVTIDLSIQEKIFKEQIIIAEQIHKPIIIHCVKAFDDLIRIKKEMKITVPLIVYGYNNNLQIATELIKNGFCISLGKALLIEESNASKVISAIPFEHLFLETDDSDFTIKEVYEAAAKHLKKDIELLKQLIYKNYIKIFNHE